MNGARALFFFTAAVAIGCSSDDTNTAAAPLEPPTLSIASITPAGGPAWTPESGTCLEIGQDAAGTVAVTAKLGKDFSLRPPNTCGGLKQCGRLVFRLDPSGDSETLEIEAAQATIDVGLAEAGVGSHSFQLELVKDNGTPVLGEDKAPLVAAVTLDVKSPGGCGGAVDAGSDASGDAASDAAVDSGTDAGSDAGSDAAPDATVDATVDAAQDSGADAPLD